MIANHENEDHFCIKWAKINVFCFLAPKIVLTSVVTWNHLIVYKSFVLDENTWYDCLLINHDSKTKKKSAFFKNCNGTLTI